ncbi:hypothetical protein LINGRAHAP2_LOCUS4572 [Linum grandiflorum]
MYIGDENGSITVVRYDTDSRKLLLLPYQLSANSLYELAGCLPTDSQPVVGVLPQSFSSGNRLLIAFQHGLLILWDAVEAQILFVGGEKNLQLKGTVLSSQDEATSLPPEDTSCSLEGKEISALCWASSDGSILAVGYVDGDILFWKTPTASSPKDRILSSDIVKLQLSSAERRLPVIVLQWSASSKSGGQLFIYGGVETGSEEVLTILTLEWSSKADTLRCDGRLDLTLTGSFADMIVLSRGDKHKAALTVLTNPGQLHRFDGASLYSLLSRQERKTMVISLECPAIVPTLGPPMTTTKFVTFPMHENSLKLSCEVASAKKQHSSNPEAGSPKPITTETPHVERMYIAGYQDGSVRLWNATSPVLSLLFLIEGKVQGVEVVDFGAPVSTLDLCCHTLLLAVGTEQGLIRIYNLGGNSNEASFWFVTENAREIKNSPQGKGPKCKVAFALLHSPVESLQFSSSGAKLAVGFGCGRTAILDMSSFSVLFLTAPASSSGSPLVSVNWVEFSSNPIKSIKTSESPAKINPEEEVMLVLTKDAGITAVDAGSGKMIRSHSWHPKTKSTAISMCIIEGSTSYSGSTNGQHESNENDASTTGPAVSERSTESLILLSCEKALRLYSTKSMIQGNKKAICKVKYSVPCVWTAAFKKDGEVIGVVSLFTNGMFEFRSFPGLELVRESSLITILRWSFKDKMEKTMSCDGGHITLANGCELAFISLLSGENCFRIPESLPSLHNKDLAAAAFNVSSNQKKKQDIKPGIFTRLAKSFKGCKPDCSTDASQVYYDTTNSANLEDVFAKPPPLPEVDSSIPSDGHEKEEELHIDDIEIDEPPLPPPATTSSKQPNKVRREREELLGRADDVKPRIRTPQEIIATYRKAGDVSSAASQTKDKLLERGEKLERISRRTAALRDEAEDFASLANELVKVMEKRKWWHI